MIEASKSSRARAAEWPYGHYTKFRSTVASAASAWFAGRGLETNPRYPYILTGRDRWPQNILVPEVVAFIESKAATKKGVEAFPLHKYVHHGLSSQALLFNLMGPFVARGEVGPLAAALTAKGIRVPAGGWTPEFEYGKRDVFNEDSGQPTSIDLALRAPEPGVSAFVECKFVEREFGQCSVFTGATATVATRYRTSASAISTTSGDGTGPWRSSTVSWMARFAPKRSVPSRSTISSSANSSWLLKKAACSSS